MKDQNNIRIFFVLLSLLLWNPLSYYLIFHDNPIYHSRILTLIFWGLFAMHVGIIILIKRQKIGAKSGNAVFAFSVVSFTYLLLLWVDSLAGLVLLKKAHSAGPESKTQKGIVFEPNTEAHYSSSEFDCVAKINSIGLRDREIGAKTKETFRIICIGDSWTFGWGVNAEESWPKQMEKILLTAGKKVEVINCGQGGQYTGTYKQYLRNAIPALKPDLVLVNLLQLDDLAQLYENRAVKFETTDKKTQRVSGLSYVALEYFKESFKNILQLLNKSRNKPVDIKLNWKQTAEKMLDEMPAIEKVYYQTYDDSLRIMFESGNLNPAMMEYFIKFPDRNWLFNDTTTAASRFAARELYKDLLVMRSFCDSFKTPMQVIEMPTASFTGHYVVRRSGANNPDGLLVNNNMIDALYMGICKDLHIPFYSLTQPFIELKNKDKYFYKFDGHPNAKGYQKIAEIIAQRINSEIK